MIIQRYQGINVAGKKICTWRVFSNRNPNKEWNVKSRDSMSPPPRQLLSN